MQDWVEYVNEFINILFTEYDNGATSDNLKKYANKLGSAYTSDKEKTINDGYPILSWQ